VRYDAAMDERPGEHAVPTTQMRMALHRDFGAPRRARFQMRLVCADMALSVCETAELLTSELVTNAVMHGEGGIGLAVFVDGAGMRVEVSDDSAARPQLRGAGAGNTGGRGLQLIESCAVAWGATPRAEPAGKNVWFRLHVS
jgi:two-component sensor histidine kinase